MSKPTNFWVASTWKGVIRWYLFSSEIFINLNLFSETVILTSLCFQRHTNTFNFLIMILRFCPVHESLTWYLTTKKCVFVWAKIILAKTFLSVSLLLKKLLYISVVPWSVTLEFSFELFHKYASRKINLAYARLMPPWC